MTPVSDLRAAVQDVAAGLADGAATKSPPTLERPKQADHGDSYCLLTSVPKPQ